MLCMLCCNLLLAERGGPHSKTSVIVGLLSSEVCLLDTLVGLQLAKAAAKLVYRVNIDSFSPV